MRIDKRMEMWKGVVKGVAYLHSCQPVLVHGDLKTANILIDDHGNPQICDFGLISIFLEEGNSGMTTTSPHTGTDRYLAYELLHDQETIVPTTASDIFALGCIGLEFCFLQLPYAHRKHNCFGQIYTDIKAGKPPACRPNPHHHSDEIQIWDILDECWRKAPQDRPDAQSILAWMEDSLRFEWQITQDTTSLCSIKAFPEALPLKKSIDQRIPSSGDDANRIATLVPNRVPKDPIFK